MPSITFLPGAGETDVSPAEPLTLQSLPSVDRLLNLPGMVESTAQHGRTVTKRAIQHVIAEARAQLLAQPALCLTVTQLLAAVEVEVRVALQPQLRPVFNLTGTVIHTNLGRSPLPEAAITALVNAARNPVTLEYDLSNGERGERDSLTETLLCELTGAEAATIVNNTAAAVLLTLSALAHGKEVAVSRGELVEIGGSFRIPDVMHSAGCKLVEVGTTNRTHLYDYEHAITDQTALFARIHTSNFAIVGFTASPTDAALAQLAKQRGIALMVDLGSGALVPFERYGLPREPLPRDALIDGADVVTFSGDKLLGGPQSGIIVGQRDLIERIRKHPLKRALRCDKLILGALEAVLRIYHNTLDTPAALAQQLPVLRLLTRPAAAIRQTALLCLTGVQAALQNIASVRVCATRSQIGSGSLPVERLDSWALVLTPLGKRSGRTVHALEAALRGLPTPVIGRIQDGAVWLDLRTLEHPDAMLAQFHGFTLRPIEP